LSPSLSLFIRHFQELQKETKRRESEQAVNHGGTNSN